MRREADVTAALMTDRDIAQLRDTGVVAVLPVGAIEQHGAHLPVDTDTVCATAVAIQAARRMVEAAGLVFPTLSFGFSPHHLSRPSTISMPLDVFLGQVRAAVGCLRDSGFRRIALINGHGGNIAPLRAVVTEMVTSGIEVTSVDYWEPARDVWTPLLRGAFKGVGHACEFETALQLALRPEDVAATIAGRARDLPPRLTQPYVADGAEDGFASAGAWAPPIFLSDDSGYYGDPGAATAETGHALLESTATGLAGFLDWFAHTPLVVGRS